MTEVRLTELGFKCGCVFAIHKKNVMVKVCSEHYEKLRKIGIETILEDQLRVNPKDVWKEMEAKT